MTPRRVRVAFNALLLSSGGGYRSAGIHRYIEGLLGALAAEDLEVVAFTADARARATLPPGVAVRTAPPVVIRSRSLRAIWEQTLLPARLVPLRPDIVHGAAHALPVWGPGRGVVTVHDLSFFRHPAAFPPAQGAYLRWALSAAVGRARAIIAVSSFTARELGAVLGVPGERVHVVPNGVDMRPPSPTERAAFHEGRELAPGYVLAVGTLQPRKNLRTLLEAYARLVHDVAAAPTLVVAGAPGWGGVTVDGLARELGVGDRVRGLGYVAPDELAALYAGAAVLAMPSRYEGFGLPVLEAMASGVPAVVATGSALEETAGAGGVAVGPDDVDGWAAALADLLRDREKAEGIGRAGRERARAFTWRRAAAATADVYRAAAAETAPALEATDAGV